MSVIIMKLWKYLVYIITVAAAKCIASDANFTDKQTVESQGYLNHENVTNTWQIGQSPPISYGFEIDYKNNQFLLDGKPFRYVSGSFHYFRTPAGLWRDRLRKIRAAGLNAISTYVAWNFHEPEPGIWRWTGDADLVAFLEMAQEEDLLVLLRPGPYIDAERDWGGLPPWLMSAFPDIKVRTSDWRYMLLVESYLDKLFSKIEHLLRGNGGPIIMVQIENEYGSFHACDTTYKNRLRDAINRHVKSKAVLYTTDGSTDRELICGMVSGAYATIDFGVFDDVQSNFDLMRKYQPNGPLVNSEFYSGWLTYWNEPFQRVPAQQFIKTLREILLFNASLNIYMIHGGTNFGFTAGADGEDRFRPVITSYDYDAPLTEAGDPTDKYFAIRNTLAEFLPMPKQLPVPTVSPKGNYGSIQLKPVMRLLNNSANNLFVTVIGRFDVPPTFEELMVFDGLILYESMLPVDRTDPTVVHAKIADRGLVYVDDFLVGTLSRSLEIDHVVVENRYAKKMGILVESQGHLDYGNVTNDWKGIFNVSINNKLSFGKWNVTAFSLSEMMPLADFTKITIEPKNLTNGPVLFRATFFINEDPLDTFLNTKGWGKGFAYINGRNLGRYWPQTGPQVTLYVPSVFLKNGENELAILELEYVPENMRMIFQTTADFGL